MIKKVLIGLVLWMVCFSVDAKQSLNVLFVNPSVPGEPFGSASKALQKRLRINSILD